MLLLIAVVITLVAVSLLLSKRVRSAKDYMIGGGRIPFFVIALTMAATQFGGSSLIGGLQQGAAMGFWPGVYPVIGMTLALVGASVIGPKFRAYEGAVTPPDFIEARYGRSPFLRLYHAVTYILVLLAMSASQVISFAQLASAFGIPYSAAVWICSVSVLLIAMLSGMWGVAVTDAIQFGAILILLPIMGFFSLGALKENGVSLASVVSEPVFASREAFAAFMYSTVPILFGTMFNYDTFTRYQSAKDLRSVRRASLLGACALACTILPIGSMGSAVNRLYAGTADADVTGVLITNILPGWAGAVFAAIVMMALLTSADSFFTSISTSVTRDIYQKVLCKGTPDNRKLLRVSRGTLIAAAVIVSAAATHFTAIIKVTYYFSPLTTGVMFAPMVLGVLWKGASRRGAMLSVLCSGVVALCHILELFVFIDRTLGVMIVGTLTLILFSLILQGRTSLYMRKRGARNI